MSKRVLFTTLGLPLAAYGIYEHHRLHALYPLLPSAFTAINHSANHRAAQISGVGYGLDPGDVPVEYMVAHARVPLQSLPPARPPHVHNDAFPNPQSPHHPEAAHDVTPPLAAYLSAFFSGWTIKAEVVLGKLLKLHSSRPDLAPHASNFEHIAPRGEFAGGLFQVVDAAPGSVTVFWDLDRMGWEGTQVLSATEVGRDDEAATVEIAYGCSQRLPEGWARSRVFMDVHHTYMAYLLDRTKGRLERPVRRQEE